MKVRFGRRERFASLGLTWRVYEAEEVGDYENGELLAAFAREADARAFIYGTPVNTEEGTPA